MHVTVDGGTERASDVGFYLPLSATISHSPNGCEKLLCAKQRSCGVFEIDVALTSRNQLFRALVVQGSESLSEDSGPLSGCHSLRLQLAGTSSGFNPERIFS
jgi:hypothetical protein